MLDELRQRQLRDWWDAKGGSWPYPGDAMVLLCQQNERDALVIRELNLRRLQQEANSDAVRDSLTS